MSDVATTPTDDQITWLDKVRKLIAKAESPASSAAETEAYYAMANKIAAKHNLAALLAQHVADPTAHLGTADRIFNMPNPWSNERIRLVANIAIALGCRVVRLPNKPGKGREVHVFGTTADIERVDLLLTSLLLTMASHAERDWNDRGWLAGGSSRKYKGDYMFGFCNRIANRLMETQAAAEAESSAGTDLVLVRREEAIEKHVVSVYPKLVKGRASNRRVGLGYLDGTAAADGANLGTGSGVTGGTGPVVAITGR